MSLRVSSTGLGLAVKYNRRYGLVPVRRNIKTTYCAAQRREAEMNQEQEKKKPSPHDEISKNTEGDMMRQSFGEGYATRSEEEGFGGIYSRNDPIENSGHLANHPEYDKSQGCEVKEKEKARNARDDALGNARDGAHGA